MKLVYEMIEEWMDPIFSFYWWR